MSEQNQRFRLAESRRSFLKGSGTAMASIPIAPQLLQNLSTERLELERTRCPVMGITFEVAEEVKLPEIDVVQAWPNLGWKGELRNVSPKDRTMFVINLDSDSLQAGEGVLLFSPSGVRRVPSSETVSFDYLPITANKQGGRTQIEGASGPSMRISANEGTGSIAANGDSISIESGKTATTRVPKKLSTRNGEKTFTLSITASYFGSREVVGHKDRLILPNTSSARRLVGKIKGYKKDGTHDSKFAFPAQRTTVRKLDGYEAYSLNVKEGK